MSQGYFCSLPPNKALKHSPETTVDVGDETIIPWAYSKYEQRGIWAYNMMFAIIVIVSDFPIGQVERYPRIDVDPTKWSWHPAPFPQIKSTQSMFRENFLWEKKDTYAGSMFNPKYRWGKPYDFSTNMIYIHSGLSTSFCMFAEW